MTIYLSLYIKPYHLRGWEGRWNDILYLSQVYSTGDEVKNGTTGQKATANGNN